jgi:hypothetical protein
MPGRSLKCLQCKQARSMNAALSTSHSLLRITSSGEVAKLNHNLTESGRQTMSYRIEICVFFIREPALLRETGQQLNPAGRTRRDEPNAGIVAAGKPSLQLSDARRFLG